MKAQWESTIHPLQKNLKYRPRWSMVYQFPHWKSRYYINIHMSWYFNCNITSTSIYQRCDLSTVTIYQPLNTSTVTHYKLYDPSRYQNVNCNKLIYFLLKFFNYLFIVMIHVISLVISMYINVSLFLFLFERVMWLH